MEISRLGLWFCAHLPMPLMCTYFQTHLMIIFYSSHVNFIKLKKIKLFCMFACEIPSDIIFVICLWWPKGFLILLSSIWFCNIVNVSCTVNFQELKKYLFSRLKINLLCPYRCIDFKNAKKLHHLLWLRLLFLIFFNYLVYNKIHLHRY